MNILPDNKIEAFFLDGYIHVKMESGVEIKFPVDKNPRLSKGATEQLNNIEVSPLGLHWPDLDEDLSFEGLSHGDFGQFNH